ncbi:MAG: IS66 family insertion sequence element accessory protein TnpA [Gemmataceae bacterium]
MSINRKPRTEQRLQNIIKDFQESSQSIRSYCLRRAITEGVFHYWLHRHLSAALNQSLELYKRYADQVACTLADQLHTLLPIK